MSEALTGPSGLGTAVRDDLVLTAAERIEKFGDAQRDILYYYVSGESDSKTAHDLGFKDTANLGRRRTLILNGFEFPHELTDEEVQDIVREALALSDEKEKKKTPPSGSAVKADAPAPQPPADTTEPEPVVTNLSVPAESPAPPAPVPDPDAATLPVRAEPMLSVSSTQTPSGVKVLGIVVEVPILRLRRFEGQPRTEFDPVVIESLSKSMQKVGQLMPALLRRVEDDPRIDYEIIDGECRWLSCQKAGLATFHGIEYPGLSIEDAKKQYKISVISNFGRSRHTALELAFAAKKIMDDDQCSVADVAVSFCLSEATIRYHLRLLRLEPEVQALMRVDISEPQRLKVGQALFLVDYPAEFQRLIAQEMSEKKLKGNKSRWYIRERAAEMNVVPERSRKGRRPANDARIIERGLDRFNGLVDQYLRFPGTSVTGIFNRRSPEEQGNTINLIDGIVEKLNAIRAGIEEARN